MALVPFKSLLWLTDGLISDTNCKGLAILKISCSSPEHLKGEGQPPYRQGLCYGWRFQLKQVPPSAVPALPHTERLRHRAREPGQAL